MSNPPLNVFISAGEASGDAHAAAVIRRLSQQCPGVRLSGLGGPAMAESGCNLLENMVDKSTMGLHVLGKLGFYRHLLKRVKEHLLRDRPDVVVTVDSFDGNIHIATAAWRLGIPVLIYIAPQLWAWWPGRIRKIRKINAKVACILPFEQEWFGSRGVDVTYVGHPLFDDADSPEVASEPAAGPFPVVALLPGSRRHEVERHWPGMLDVAWRIKAKYPDVRFRAAVLNEAVAEDLRRQTDPMLGVEIGTQGVDLVSSQADLTIVVSGTATLQVARQLCPMIVIYDVKPILWHLVGRRLLKTKHISLVNILAKRELVSEFIPFASRTWHIGQKALEMLENADFRRKMRSDLAELIRPLNQAGAARHVVELILQFRDRD